MTEINQARALERLWDVLGTHKAGMLGLCNSMKHMQPMTAFGERETDTLWFFTYNDTELARDIAEKGSAHAMYCLDSGERDLYACLGGKVSLERDMTRIEKFWNMHVAAWYPNGKTDERLTLIRFDLDDAELWVSEKGAIGYMAEVAKANITHTTPYLGQKVSVQF